VSKKKGGEIKAKVPDLEKKGDWGEGGGWLSTQIEAKM
jgi:hypothetical protein